MGTVQKKQKYIEVIFIIEKPLKDNSLINTTPNNNNSNINLGFASHVILSSSHVIANMMVIGGLHGC